MNKIPRFRETYTSLRDGIQTLRTEIVEEMEQTEQTFRGLKSLLGEVDELLQKGATDVGAGATH
jgi:archaellum component FlaC